MLQAVVIGACMQAIGRVAHELHEAPVVRYHTHSVSDHTDHKRCSKIAEAEAVVSVNEKKWSRIPSV